MSNSMAKSMKGSKSIETAIEAIQNYDAQIAYERWGKLGKNRKG